MAEDFRKECSSLMNVSGAHRSIPSVLAAFALLSAILVVGGDAQTDSLPGIATIHVSTDVIEVPVLAFKPPFRRVSGLLSEDFLIRLDGGSSFHPRYVHVEGLEPLSLGVLVDAEVRDTKILSVSLQNGMRHLSPDFVSDIDRWSVYLSGCRLVRTMNYGQIHSSTNRDPWMEAFSTSSFQAASQGDSTCHPPAVDQAIGAGIAQLALTFGWRVLLVLVNENQKIAIHALDDLRAKAAAGGVTLFVIRYPDRASFPKATDAETDGFHLLSSSLGGISVFSSFEDLGKSLRKSSRPCAAATSLASRDLLMGMAVSIPSR